MTQYLSTFLDHNYDELDIISTGEFSFGTGGLQWVITPNPLEPTSVPYGGQKYCYLFVYDQGMVGALFSLQAYVTTNGFTIIEVDDQTVVCLTDKPLDFTWMDGFDTNKVKGLMYDHMFETGGLYVIVLEHGVSTDSWGNTTPMNIPSHIKQFIPLPDFPPINVNIDGGSIQDNEFRATFLLTRYACDKAYIRGIYTKVAYMMLSIKYCYETMKPTHSEKFGVFVKNMNEEEEEFDVNEPNYIIHLVRDGDQLKVTMVTTFDQDLEEVEGLDNIMTVLNLADPQIFMD